MLRMLVPRHRAVRVGMSAVERCHTRLSPRSAGTGRDGEAEFPEFGMRHRSRECLGGPVGRWDIPRMAAALCPVRSQRKIHWQAAPLPSDLRGVVTSLSWPHRLSATRVRIIRAC